MRLRRTAQIAFRDLVNHAFRSALTALGMVFGVGAVVAMMAISEGARIESLRRIAALGIENIELRSVKPRSGANAANDRIWTAAEYGITARDLDHLRTSFDNIRDIVPVRDLRENVYIAGVRSDIRVFATTPEFLALSKSRLCDARGRFLCALDEANPPQAVCVVGRLAARKLFSFRDPFVRTVSLKGVPFRVVGLLENPASIKILDGADLENSIFIPLRAATVFFGKTTSRQTSGSFETAKVEADFAYIRVRAIQQIENTAARLRTWLKETHPTVDYDISVPYDLLKQNEAIQRTYTIVLASIAAISLLVGGIGIMNIMMANVYERTKEIGTRRALGARKRDILWQFLLESLLLTIMGGLAGVGAGAAMARMVEHYAEMETAISLFSIFLSVGVSVGVGLIFGTYPAWKAAHFDPVIALRTE